MVLKKLQNIQTPKITKCAKLFNGKWKFDSACYFGCKDSEKYWNDEYENVLNGPDLYLCNRCHIPDTKENLDKHVEHTRYQCEEKSYMFKIYKKLSDNCREDPSKSVKCLEELKKVTNNTKFQENSHNVYVIRNVSPETWSREFDIPMYQGDNMVTQKWKENYHSSLKKAENLPKLHTIEKNNLFSQFNLFT
jgi:hypothetical protein